MARLGRNNQPVCSFCGRPADEHRRVVSSPDDMIYICEHCVATCQTILNNEAHTIAPIDMSAIPSPKEFKAYLDQYVIGQDYAKKSSFRGSIQSLQAAFNFKGTATYNGCEN